MREGEVVVLRIRTDRADAGRVYGCKLRVQHLHVADVVYEHRLFQYHDQSLAIHLHSDDHAVKCELAYC